MATPDPDFDAQRQSMVQQQLAGRDIVNANVLEAMRSVPRHLFVPEGSRHMAYWDGPLSIGEGQTISQPYIVALMTQLLAPTADDKVLEIGCGSGYQAAVLAHMAAKVITVERHASLASRAEAVLKDLGYANVQVEIGDGSLGFPPGAPFDAVIVTAATPTIPEALKSQTAEHGRIVAPVGSLGSQVLELLTRKGSEWHLERSIPVMFVPLIGEQGWGEGDTDRGRWWF